MVESVISGGGAGFCVEDVHIQWKRFTTPFALSSATLLCGYVECYGNV